MKRCKTHVVGVCLFLLASVAAYGQRGTFGIDIGQTSDKFSSLSSVSGLEVGVDGQVTVLRENQKTGRPGVVAGGEIRLPSDTGNHAREYSVFGGPRFHARDLSIGFNVQVHKIVLPTASVDNQFFNRYTIEMLEIPLVLKYTFGPSKRTFLEVQGAPEFSPKFKKSSSLIFLAHPNFDYGYFVRGSLGYTFHKSYYAKVTYETRYFRFISDPENPSNLYNWKSNLISGGVGVSF